LTSSAFLVAYDSAIDTLFICFLLDEKHNKGRYDFAPEDLGDVIALTCRDAIQRHRFHKGLPSTKRSRTEDAYLEEV
jgi:hypothetical protein